MRKQWFGDSRDYVKWSCVLAEAGEKYAVVYAPMLRDDSHTGDKLHATVKTFFDKHKDFGVLGQLFKAGFVYLSNRYEVSRSDEYFDQLEVLISTNQRESNIIVFLDPDTGIEPANKSQNEHLRKVDIQRVCKCLRPEEKLIIYQHSSRSVGWMTMKRKELEPLALRTSTLLSEPYFELGTAKDVCFFIFTKKG